jgi:NADPH2:quinone reductase
MGVLVTMDTDVCFSTDSYTKNEPERIPEVWKALFELFESGKLIPALYDNVYSFSDIPKGLKAINDRASYAKVVATVGRDSKI